MKRFTFVVMMLCALAPATARANSGGFWDFLYSLDPKLTGFGTDVHLACLNANGERVPGCEEMWGMRRAENIDVRNIKHEVDLRVAYYWKYGVSYEGVPAKDSIKAFKLIGMYKYHPDVHITVGLGGGVMPFFGHDEDGNGFNSFSRGVLVPLSVTYAPATQGDKWKKSFFMRAEASFITEGFSRGDFKNGVAATETKGEWNFSVATGFDFRRRFLNR